jgi:hypothetical protein
MSTVHYRHLPEAVAKFEAAGGWALKAKVASVLNGLGFTDADAWPLLIGSLIHEDNLSEALVSTRLRDYGAEAAFAQLQPYHVLCILMQIFSTGQFPICCRCSHRTFKCCKVETGRLFHYGDSLTSM